jgi:hypothetical protein
MIEVLVIPKRDDISTDEMFNLWEVVKCVQCLRFYFMETEHVTMCNICANTGQCYTVACDNTGHIKKTNEKTNRITNDYEENYKKIKKIVTSQNSGKKWKIPYNKFVQIMQNCYLCDRDINRSYEFNRAHSYIIDDTKDIIIGNFCFVCNVCYRMGKIFGSYDMLIKKCVNIVSHSNMNCDSIIVYKNVSSMGVCQLKYDGMKRVKEKAGYIFDISEYEYISLICDNCKYCNRSSDCSNINDIVLIENDVGYCDGNCITCCKDCKLMRANMSNYAFINHITLITENNIIKIQNMKRLQIRNKTLRLYTYLNNDQGYPTNIVFDNLNTDSEWNVIYNDEFNGSFDGVFFKMENINDIGSKTVTDIFKLDNGVHKIMYLGLSQSNDSIMTISDAPIYSINDVDKIMENIRINRDVLQENSDISIRVPYKQNCITISVHRKYDTIVGIEFTCDMIHSICNCYICTTHLARCGCNNCIHHMIQNSINKNFTCNNFQIIGNNRIKERYIKNWYKFDSLDFNKQKQLIYDAVDKQNSMMMKNCEVSLKSILGKDEYNKKKVIKTAKQREKKIKETGIVKYREDKREYMKIYRKQKKGDRVKVQVDSKTRKQVQRERMMEKYGIENYKKIVSLDTKITRAKKSGKPEHEIEQLKIELNNIKQNFT